MGTNGLLYQKIYGELGAAVQLHKETKIETDRVRKITSFLDNSDGALAINYDVQGRYNCQRKHQQANKGYRKPKTADTLSIMGFFICDFPDHFYRDCTRPKDNFKASKRSL